MAAISLTKVLESAPALAGPYRSAGVSLTKHGLEGVRAAVYLVVDHSGSMRPYYRDGSVQALADRVLGLSAHLDDDGTVPVVFFSTDVDAVAEITLAGHEGRIGRIAAGLGHMGRTHYEAAMDAVIDHYLDSGARDPALVVFQTDGGPSSRTAAERHLCKAARLPLFWQFIGFGDPDSRRFDYLRRLDELAVPARRVVDNAGFFHAGRDPRRMSDARLYDLLLGEFPQWLAAARAAGIVRGGTGAAGVRG
ncbi:MULTISPECIES: vWA domain-containing protein [unclassified Streptomyces]|uniref:vWA domain-containing protein n=1 Tax=unclassified Streptomyces TaxID=2593676 RepID=UPI001369BBFA|nr:MULTISPECIES: VWA domain-containing protein [unclassified Streptomyces]MCW5249358.1 VWA domain-containing protein [Streptomyces sp. SHP 1-2]MYU21603.1 VWA domain-containing protein [Streptomyces sp. SID8352]